MSLGYGKTASSPVLARDLAMLRSNDRFVNNRDRLFSEAVTAIEHGSEQISFTRESIAMAGRGEVAKMVSWAEDMHTKGKLFKHDVFVSTEIARIVTGGDIDAGTLWSEQDLYDAERRAFLTLVKTPETQARICGLLDDGKAVRN